MARPVTAACRRRACTRGGPLTPAPAACRRGALPRLACAAHPQGRELRGCGRARRSLVNCIQKDRRSIPPVFFACLLLRSIPTLLCLSLFSHAQMHTHLVCCTYGTELCGNCSPISGPPSGAARSWPKIEGVPPATCTGGPDRSDTAYCSPPTAVYSIQYAAKHYNTSLPFSVGRPCRLRRGLAMLPPGRSQANPPDAGWAQCARWARARMRPAAEAGSGRGAALCAPADGGQLLGGGRYPPRKWRRAAAGAREAGARAAVPAPGDQPRTGNGAGCGWAAQAPGGGGSPPTIR